MHNHTLSDAGGRASKKSTSMGGARLHRDDARVRLLRRGFGKQGVGAWRHLVESKAPVSFRPRAGDARSELIEECHHRVGHGSSMAGPVHETTNNGGLLLRDQYT